MKTDSDAPRTETDGDVQPQRDDAPVSAGVAIINAYYKGYIQWRAQQMADEAFMRIQWRAQQMADEAFMRRIREATAVWCIPVHTKRSPPDP